MFLRAARRFQTRLANDSSPAPRSKENLGRKASLLAAAALMIDYVLNVAVGISAGVAALVSAFPALHPYILPLCLGILCCVMLMNLRGTLETGRVFAIPAYTFVASFVVILALGLYKAVTTGADPQPVIAPPPLRGAVEAVTLWLLLLAGVAYLVRAYHIGAMDQTQNTYRSVLSQLASAVVGDGALYYVAIGSLPCALVLSANTSFAGFPRLCRSVAPDGFLPRPFAIAGHRLVFSIARALRMNLLTNAADAVTTATALVIITVARFSAGSRLAIVNVPWYLEEQRV